MTTRLDDRNATRRSYIRLSRAYDFLANSSERRIRDEGIHALGLAPGQSVLGIGCGTGQGLLSLARAVGDGGRVQGVDLSRGMISVARTASAGARNVCLAIGDARALCFRSKAFDAVFLSFTLELFGDQMMQVLAEARRVLQDRGRIGVVAMAETGHSNPMIATYKWMHRRWPHVVDCRPIDVPGALRTAGFQVGAVHAMTIWSLPVIAVIGEKPAP